ncbi:MAG: 16S rRNA (adenine(1518)-N(6)/adenine(1519)-N(6))-dimethyltransferase RsmA [Dehalococcoidales bacterium]|nr:16S rRNA (adenine(1518)-N(6)/adenine(1519)-N(6))-dimethyltransferase RsmA [Dehalococcoidales bacterium]MDP7416118.1 16S rRNA (adenine(1518)-N(6)/adenine(1519)-N(6))-dimethyltransferase RsmA [Dehalococcoidales bacterium]
MKTESLLTQTKRILRHFDLKSRKRLGQHFLVDEEVLQLIAASAEIDPSDTIVEIGPGLGILTGELARRAGLVIAVELDDKLAASLTKTLASFSNINIINQDILRLDPAALLPAPGPYKVVANLPYYITSPVLRHFLEATVKPKRMIVMVQKEVAEAITAGPGQRSMISISVQFYGKPKIVSYVPARAFYPAPEVNSALLRIEVYPRPLIAVTDDKGFFQLVRSGFTASRKQIANSLAQGLGRPKVEVLALLEKAGIVPQRRAETLTFEEWAQLWQVFTRRKEEK